MSAPDLSPDERATITERQITDEERFSLLISVIGVNPGFPVRDKRIPQGVAMSVGRATP
jgi:beta-glucosidase